MDTHTLISRIINKYGERYDYSEVIWKGSKEKIFLRCSEHGTFSQRPDSLLSGHACQKCGRASAAIKNTYTLDEIILILKEIYGDRYNLTTITFENYDTPIKIHCVKHGWFWKMPNDLIVRKRGCPKCSNRVRKTNDEYIREAKMVYGNIFDYSLINYKNNKTKIKIICPSHGIFEQTPKTHLKGVIGCNQCVIEKMSVSKPETEWLDSLKVKERNKYIKIDTGRALNVDGLDPVSRRAYLFHGDFWHGNPKYYKDNDYNPKSKKTFGELYEKTLTNEKRLRDAGYEVVVMWESDWLMKKGKKYYSGGGKRKTS